MTPPRRCAIYTRKSSEEGLEQQFNSLHAQREACEAYIRSQAGEGWKLLRTAYDDGGFSGGSMNRPGLQTLLADIDEGRIDIVVVYKVDRLTRSLTDFSKIVEIFEAHGVSFVSVTQAFNTTTSMGRLTLNVLLSFAQFEREVTGERIRDKFAASKKKGMWMGGPPPLGYDIRDRKLHVNPGEAERVRHIYERYLELGSVTSLVPDLSERGIRSKSWVSQRGNPRGGVPFGRGALYALLKNRIYLGQVTHKGAVHEGEHEAILPSDLWDRVQAILDTHRRKERKAPSKFGQNLLVGLLFDDQGNPMTPSHTKKPSGRRYRYYVSQALIRGRHEGVGSVSRVPAEAIERFVAERVKGSMEKEPWGELSPGAEAERIRSVLHRVVIHTQEVVVTWKKKVSEGENDQTPLRIPFRLKSRGRESVILPPDAPPSRARPDKALITAVVRAHAWREALESGKGGVQPIGCTDRYLRKVRPLAFLAPDITQAILQGTQPAELTLARLLRSKLTISWKEQRQKLGFLPIQ
ncbi:MAG: recombinase family protein [Candidatus Tectomicrobia bacterium]|uniref:Recombinase family protein n=1 Tax=Tectimicrobiota bacterium TaxID=2528274 RepID=A0A932MQ82_UNCTE|nr:recombinase family protein [Candidatus Tectomicrobia bacterium]